MTEDETYWKCVNQALGPKYEAIELPESEDEGRKWHKRLDRVTFVENQQTGEEYGKEGYANQDSIQFRDRTVQI